MKSMNRQSGVSVIGVLLIVALFSFFLTVMLRLVPTYVNGRSVGAALNGVVEISNPKESLRAVNNKVSTAFTTNQIEGISARGVKVYRDKGAIIIDARHEVRTKLFDGIDAVLMFDDLVFTIE
ncbi:MAG: DUF4845 domain-containing protein [Gammaproteobacteria bacterium]|nr:DUF4845 domain-containing protein [Gammaproteobacteria bacterium]